MTEGIKAVGIDVGSLATKAVILDNNSVLASVVVTSSDDAELNAKNALQEALTQAGLRAEDKLYIVATGIGGKSVAFSQQQKAITTCLARGVRYLMPTVRLAIDMGAESSTVIRVNERGRLAEWTNQDKCAAGTGMFLKQMSKLMQVSLDEMSALSLSAKGRAEISSTCAVFAESEVISHVHRVPPTPKEDIIAGIYFSVVTRIMSLCKRIGIEKDVAAVGGVALSRGLVSILEKELGFKVLVPEMPQTVAALGAAILAKENMQAGLNK